MNGDGVAFINESFTCKTHYQRIVFKKDERIQLYFYPTRTLFYADGLVLCFTAAGHPPGQQWADPYGEVRNPPVERIIPIERIPSTGTLKRPPPHQVVTIRKHALLFV